MPLIKMSPNTDIVMVTHSKDRVEFYEAKISVNGYIRSCEAEGKKAEYVGKTDDKGELIFNL